MSDVVYSISVVEIPVTTTVLNVDSTQTVVVELGLIGPQDIDGNNAYKRNSVYHVAR